jgi:prolyl-tRNA editing enzyme YbaK/EbsC (Cys-tRNA(Pro) deacylase)
VVKVLVVAEYLKMRGIPFEVVRHPRTFTSVEEARTIGVDVDEVLKTLVFDYDGRHAVVVVPASRRVDPRLVRGALGDHHAHLATEGELTHDFSGYELGAVPPLGSLVGARTLVDPEVFLHDTVAFAAGSQTESITCDVEDLFRGRPITCRRRARTPAERAIPHDEGAPPAGGSAFVSPTSDQAALG